MSVDQLTAMTQQIDDWVATVSDFDQAEAEADRAFLSAYQFLNRIRRPVATIEEIFRSYVLSGDVTREWSLVADQEDGKTRLYLCDHHKLTGVGGLPVAAAGWPYTPPARYFDWTKCSREQKFQAMTVLPRLLIRATAGLNKTVAAAAESRKSSDEVIAFLRGPSEDHGDIVIPFPAPAAKEPA